MPVAVPVVVVATIRPVPAHETDVIAALEAVISSVHDEDGCLLYALHEGKDRLVMIEKWSSAEALATHSQGDAVAELNAALEGLVAGPVDVQVLQPHPAGTTEQGAL
ncbi:MAG TPA: putative quinol monooxygenase [Streptosporangiaceae bacterium]|nr:putative quinol monooxygenase [Streptosporangiaceae bacterium]